MPVNQLGMHAAASPSQFAPVSSSFAQDMPLHAALQSNYACSQEQARRTSFENKQLTEELDLVIRSMKASLSVSEQLASLQTNEALPQSLKGNANLLKYLIDKSMDQQLGLVMRSVSKHLGSLIQTNVEAIQN